VKHWQESEKEIALNPEPIAGAPRQRGNTRDLGSGTTLLRHTTREVIKKYVIRWPAITGCAWRWLIRDDPKEGKTFSFINTEKKEEKKKHDNVLCRGESVPQFSACL
jgi:hypothetical protein